MKISDQETTVQSFTRCISQRVQKIADRAIAILYYYARTSHDGATLQQIVEDYRNAGLGVLNVTKLRHYLSSDRRTSKIARDKWILKIDKIKEVEKTFHLGDCLRPVLIKAIAPDGVYVNKTRYKALKRKKGKFDFSRLLQMLVELEDAYRTNNFISVILLVRAILDHVPPIFAKASFIEVANNYGSKSLKAVLQHLENSSRKIADSYLHTPIRSKETLPNSNQVNFSADLDFLLAEIVRIS